MSRKLRSVHITILLIVLTAGLVLCSQSAFAEDKAQSITKITEWQMLWEQPGEELTVEQVSALPDAERWFPIQAGGDYPVVLENVKSAWLKIVIPDLVQNRPALHITKLYARDFVFYMDDNVVLERYRNYSFDLNEVVVPVSKTESNKTLYIHLYINFDRLGLQNEIVIDEYDTVYKNYIRFDLIDVVLGAGLIFIAFFMMVSVLFLNRSFFPGWSSLFVIMLSTGVMILTYSNFVEKIFPEYGMAFYLLFDFAAAMLLPALLSFFEIVFGKGPYGIISKYKKIQFYFIAIYMIATLSSLFSNTFAESFVSLGIVCFGISLLIGNLILLIAIIHQFRSRNEEALILSMGIAVFVSVGLFEIVWYFYNDKLYKMFFWKISILFFLASLVIILVRRVMRNYELAVQYSKQIEIFNNELQRSEKIELISNLAASIAHEVRNPLQVTRGFLQLLGNKTQVEKDKSYMTLAIDELDRASEIITDFLTFAKPDLGEMMQLDISEELEQIVAILAPLATMSGGVIVFNREEKLHVRGNSSRLKQALINIIKNSIEALGEDGKIEILLQKSSNNEIVIQIKDNGEGIHPDDLKRLGEPYYSKKTKGTGLGLMVTFRIVESMNGKISMKSTVGIGTEVCITLPAL